MPRKCKELQPGVNSDSVVHACMHAHTQILCFPLQWNKNLCTLFVVLYNVALSLALSPSPSFFFSDGMPITNQKIENGISSYKIKYELTSQPGDMGGREEV